MARRQLLIDYGEVISTAQPAADVAALAGAAGLTAAELARRYWVRRPEYDRGGSARRYWTEVIGSAPTDDQLDRLIELDLRSWLHFEPAMLSLVVELRATGTPLSLLSNAPRELARALAERLELRGFRHLLFSADLGLVKPDPAIYRIAVRRLRAEPDEVVFVDDRAANVRAAAEQGLTAIRYTATPECRALIRRAVAG